VAVGTNVLQAVQAAQPEVASASVVVDPAPTVVNPVSQDVFGNGRVAFSNGMAPVDVQLDLRDAAGNRVTTAASPPQAPAASAADGAAAAPGDASADPAAGVVTVVLPLGQASEPGAQFHWLHEVFDGGVFLGYSWSPDEVVDEAAGTVTIPLPVAQLQGTVFLPVSITPGLVANHDPLEQAWSGPTLEARNFGYAGPQFTTFPVLAPQVGLRLFVFSPVVDNYAWLDVAGVGPVGPPDS
jgi:hypothetical protein